MEGGMNSNIHKFLADNHPLAIIPRKKWKISNWTVDTPVGESYSPVVTGGD
jgi:hypothetical protein